MSVQDGVILGADTRSTAGTTVADKNCEKIHYIADNIYCCGAGTAADTENVTQMVSSHLKLHQYATGRKSRVITALTMLKQHLFGYQGHISAALVLGGVDLNGPHIFTVRLEASESTIRSVSCSSPGLRTFSCMQSLNTFSPHGCV
jgi:20S proteasome subunit beta 2